MVCARSKTQTHLGATDAHYSPSLGSHPHWSFHYHGFQKDPVCSRHNPKRLLYPGAGSCPRPSYREAAQPASHSTSCSQAD